MTADDIIALLRTHGFGPAEVLENTGAPGQASILLNREHALAAATFLRDSPGLRLDYASNVTGIDWPERTVQEKRKETKLVEGVEKEAETISHVKIPGYLEVVYHLYSMELKQGPVIVRVRTGNRDTDVSVPSLTPVWRGAEFQEREVFDLFGVHFEGHPDLRRILMWDGFADHPMRKDYVEPDDFEYEPTAHGDVAERAKRHQDPAKK